jgi:multicomponent K+:H+ antiporter subunit D
MAEDPVGDALPSFLDAEPPRAANLDDDETLLVGRPIPAALAFLGVAFAGCALVVAGLPPLSGFIGKLAMLSALVDRADVASWALFGLLIVSGMLAAIALVRIGIRYFWSPQARPVPRLRVVEGLPIALLLAALGLLVVLGEPVLRYLRQASEALHEPAHYIDAVRRAKPLPGAGGGPP